MDLLKSVDVLRAQFGCRQLFRSVSYRYLTFREGAVPIACERKEMFLHHADVYSWRLLTGI